MLLTKKATMPATAKYTYKCDLCPAKVTVDAALTDWIEIRVKGKNDAVVGKVVCPSCSHDIHSAVSSLIEEASTKP